MIVSKASKLLHVICFLLASVLLILWLSTSFLYVRSESCRLVWNNSLPAYLSSAIERVQMRALSIIYPRPLYWEVIQFAKFPRLDDRRY